MTTSLAERFLRETLPAYTQQATEEEEILVGKILQKLRDGPFPPRPKLLSSGAAELVSAGSHWITWLVEGCEALLVQVKDGALFLVTSEPRETLKCTHEGAGFFAGSTKPTTILRGTLALRRTRWRNGRAAYESERAGTLQTMTLSGADALPGSPAVLVFFATECLWWRTASTEDFQGRLVLGRTLSDEQPDCTASYAHGFGGARGALRLAYLPHMAPPQAPIVTRDVPRCLVGCALRGISLRPVDEASHKHVAMGGASAEDYESTVNSLAGDK